jgi:hypothetical protein
MRSLVEAVACAGRGCPNSTPPIDMTNPKVEVLPIEKGATPDPVNVNKHSQRGGSLLENSLKKRGAFRSIASAGKGVEVPTVYAGNYTLEKAVDAGFTEIVNVHVTGNQLVNVVRDDIEPGSAQAIALGLEDNESASKSYNPDIDILASLAAGDNAVLAALLEKDATLNKMVGDMLLSYDNYSRKITPPTYAPFNEKPEIFELFDDSKTRELIDEIDSSAISDNEKEFLKIAAQRHTILSFKKIADYYANSGPEVQRLMENSALVIIDLGAAISNGFVNITENIRRMVHEEHGSP